VAKGLLLLRNPASGFQLAAILSSLVRLLGPGLMGMVNSSWLHAVLWRLLEAEPQPALQGLGSTAPGVSSTRARAPHTSCSSSEAGREGIWTEEPAASVAVGEQLDIVTVLEAMPEASLASLLSSVKTLMQMAGHSETLVMQMAGHSETSSSDHDVQPGGTADVWRTASSEDEILNQGSAAGQQLLLDPEWVRRALPCLVRKIQSLSPEYLGYVSLTLSVLFPSSHTVRGTTDLEEGIMLQQYYPGLPWESPEVLQRQQRLAAWEKQGVWRDEAKGPAKWYEGQLIASSLRQAGHTTPATSHASHVAFRGHTALSGNNLQGQSEELEDRLFGCGFAGGMQELDYPIEVACDIFFGWMNGLPSSMMNRLPSSGSIELQEVSSHRDGHHDDNGHSKLGTAGTRHEENGRSKKKRTAESIQADAHTKGAWGTVAEGWQHVDDVPPWQELQEAVLQAVGGHLSRVADDGGSLSAASTPSAFKRYQQGQNEQRPDQQLLLLLPALKALVRWQTTPGPEWANQLAAAVATAAAPARDQQQHAFLLEEEPELLLACSQLLGAAAASATAGRYSIHDGPEEGGTMLYWDCPQGAMEAVEAAMLFLMEGGHSDNLSASQQAGRPASGRDWLLLGAQGRQWPLPLSIIVPLLCSAVALDLSPSIEWLQAAEQQVVLALKRESRRVRREKRLSVMKLKAKNSSRISEDIGGMEGSSSVHQDIMSLVACLAYLGLPPSKGAKVWASLEPYFPNQFGAPDLELENYVEGGEEEEIEEDWHGYDGPESDEASTTLDRNAPAAAAGGGARSPSAAAAGKAKQTIPDDENEEDKEETLGGRGIQVRTGPTFAAEVAVLLVVAASSGWEAPSKQLLPNLVDVVCQGLKKDPMCADAVGLLAALQAWGQQPPNRECGDVLLNAVQRAAPVLKVEELVVALSTVCNFSAAGVAPIWSEVQEWRDAVQPSLLGAADTWSSEPGFAADPSYSSRQAMQEDSSTTTQSCSSRQAMQEDSRTTTQSCSSRQAMQEDSRTTTQSCSSRQAMQEDSRTTTQSCSSRQAMQEDSRTTTPTTPSSTVQTSRPKLSSSSSRKMVEGSHSESQEERGGGGQTAAEMPTSDRIKADYQSLGSFPISSMLPTTSWVSAVAFELGQPSRMSCLTAGQLSSVLLSLQALKYNPSRSWMASAFRQLSIGDTSDMSINVLYSLLAAKQHHTDLSTSSTEVLQPLQHDDMSSAVPHPASAHQSVVPGHCSNATGAAGAEGTRNELAESSATDWSLRTAADSSSSSSSSSSNGSSRVLTVVPLLMYMSHGVPLGVSMTLSLVMTLLNIARQVQEYWEELWFQQEEGAGMSQDDYEDALRALFWSTEEYLQAMTYILDGISIWAEASLAVRAPYCQKGSAMEQGCHTGGAMEKGSVSDSVVGSGIATELEIPTAAHPEDLNVSLMTIYTTYGSSALIGRAAASTTGAADDDDDISSQVTPPIGMLYRPRRYSVMYQGLTRTLVYYHKHDWCRSALLPTLPLLSNRAAASTPIDTMVDDDLSSLRNMNRGYRGSRRAVRIDRRRFPVGYSNQRSLMSRDYGLLWNDLGSDSSTTWIYRDHDCILMKRSMMRTSSIRALLEALRECLLMLNSLIAELQQNTDDGGAESDMNSPNECAAVGISDNPSPAVNSETINPMHPMNVSLIHHSKQPSETGEREVLRDIGGGLELSIDKISRCLGFLT
ncbi:hypothetical protein CEUSTIGMA_g12647.t1, partial [Chlamydomonas eustigma]